jgi:hypothetical protein
MGDAVEMGSDAMTYIPSLVKISSGFRQLMGDSQTTDSMKNALSLL